MIHIENQNSNIIQTLLDDYNDNRVINRIDLYHQPDKKTILELIEKLLKVLYPGYYGEREWGVTSIKNQIEEAIRDAILHMTKIIVTVMRYCSLYVKATDYELEQIANDITYQFLGTLPKLRTYLETDIEAAYEGDPAARGVDEIILSYPGFYAISIYRLAHELTMLKVPMIPRIMSEHAHSITGIDIHPGAVIGRYFFMDHGTGIVIGETTVIGDHVKIYQGVTLGALSTKGGRLLQDVKRHPTIGNNVTIYAGATILGGDTIVGDDVVIGGNAFITKSVEKV